MSPFANMLWILLLFVNFFTNNNDYVALRLTDLSVQHTTWKAKNDINKQLLVDADTTWEEETEGESEDELLVSQINNLPLITSFSYQFCRFTKLSSCQAVKAKAMTFVRQSSQDIYIFYQNLRI